MTAELFLKMALSYIAIFFGVYLLVTMINLLEEYFREKKLLETLDMVGEEIDWGKEDVWYWSIK
jgi:hypothetical protein